MRGRRGGFPGSGEPPPAAGRGEAPPRSGAATVSAPLHPSRGRLPRLHGRVLGEDATDAAPQAEALGRGGGGLDVRVYRTEAESRVFYDLARGLSARTYQERPLGAGLPSGPEALARMLARAAQDRSRAYILFHGEVPASYLYLPVEDGCVLYAHLGYDPAFADLSPGTVLQLEALERLFAEARFAFFDFTEGDGAHKRLFGREAVECVDLLLLRRTVRNRALAVSLAGLEAAVRAVSRLAEAAGVKARLRRLVRR